MLESITGINLQEGPIIWAPLSEEFGRRSIVVPTFPLFAIFTMACALSPFWSSFLVSRLFMGIFGSSIVALSPGILADICQNPTIRGWSIAVFMGVCYASKVWTTVPPFGYALLQPTGHRFWSYAWTYRFWIYLVHPRLALVFLGCPNIRRSNTFVCPLLPRDIRTKVSVELYA